MQVSFKAELWRWREDGGWHFVTLPPELADDIRERVPLRNGFGSIRVTVTIGSSTWGTSVFPDTKTGSFLLPVKQEVRRTNDLTEGDSVPVSLVVSTD